MQQELTPPGLLLIVGTAVASLAIWAWIARRWQQQRAVLAAERRLAVPWDGAHVLLVIGAYIVSQMVAVSIADIKPPVHLHDITTADAARFFAMVNLLSLVATFAGAGALMLLAHARQEDFGLAAPAGGMGRDVLLGVFGFLAAAVPVLGLQFIVSSLVVEYEHDLLLLLAREDSRQMWQVAVLSAGVVAPVTEEFLFRGVLQGWLERRSIEPNSGISWREDIAEDGEPIRLLERTPVGMPPVWPLWAAAAVFALMHWGQGAAPIPLLIFGAIVGYLYRQTHRLIPCIVLHSLFNLFSLLIFRLSNIEV